MSNSREPIVTLNGALAPLGLSVALDAWDDPDMGEERCLFVSGSADGPFKTSRLVRTVARQVAPALASLLVLKAPAVEDQWATAAVDGWVFESAQSSSATALGPHGLAA